MIVVDCSVLIAGLLPDEIEGQAQALLEGLQLATLDSDLYNAAVEVGVAHQMTTN